MSVRNGVTRLYVSCLSSQTSARDLEHTFGIYGRVCRVDLKRHGYAFVELSNYQDADKARRQLNGIELNNRRILVEFARMETRCTNCGLYGHPTEFCDGCYKCGERGHTKRFCKNVAEDFRDERRPPFRSPGTGQSYRTSPRRDLGRERRYMSPPPSRGQPHHYSGRMGRSPMRDLGREQRYMSPPPSRGQPHHYSGQRGRYRTSPRRDLGREQRYMSPPPSRGQPHHYSGSRRSYSRSRSRPRRNPGPVEDRNVSRTRLMHPPSLRTSSNRSFPGARNESSVQEVVDADHQVQVNNNQKLVPINRSKSPVQGIVDYPYP